MGRARDEGNREQRGQSHRAIGQLPCAEVPAGSSGEPSAPTGPLEPTALERRAAAPCGRSVDQSPPSARLCATVTHVRPAVFVLVLVACASPTTPEPSTDPPQVPTPASPREPTIAKAAQPDMAPSEPAPSAGPTPGEPAPAEPTSEPAGITPPPVDDAELAALPVDLRVASKAALLETHRKDCKAFSRKTPCELVLDLDGDRKQDRAFKIRDRRTRHAGIAIAWADGSVSIIGAGARTRQLSTDVHMEGVDLEWREGTLEFADDGEVDLSWGIAPRSGEGLRKSVLRKAVVHAAPGVTGDGIWLDGGDAAEILYWDGARWRWLILGF